MVDLRVMVLKMSCHWSKMIYKQRIEVVDPGMSY